MEKLYDDLLETGSYLNSMNTLYMKHTDNILCFGELLWDNLPTGSLPGGAPMNVALHLRRFGINSRLASSVGNDEKGTALVSFLSGEGLDTSLVQVHESLPTSEVKIQLDTSGNATFEICEPVAWDDIRLTQELITAMNQSKVLVFGSLASRHEATRKTLLELLKTNIIQIMDVNLRPPFIHRDVVEPLLNHSDIVKVNDSELDVISNWYDFSGTLEEKAQQFYSHLGLMILIVTRGENGALLIHDSRLYNHRGYKVKVADTVGAGDAFLAGFLAAFCDNKSIPEMLIDACAIGAFVASKPGANPKYNRTDLLRFLEEV
jgi:fructokinase